MCCCLSPPPLPPSFELRVDPSSLPPGLHYAEVHGLLPDQEWRGPLFRVPITLIKTQQDLLTAPDIDPVEAAAAAAVVVQTPSGASSGPQAAAAAVADTSTVGSVSEAVGASGSGGGGGVSGGGGLPPHTLRLGPVSLRPGQEVRHFVAVPAGATWAELMVRADDYDTPRVFLIRCGVVEGVCSHVGCWWLAAYLPAWSTLAAAAGIEISPQQVCAKP